MPIAEPGALLMPGGSPLNYRETGFYLQGALKATWNIIAEKSPILVAVVPEQAVFASCPLGQASEPAICRPSACLPVWRLAGWLLVCCSQQLASGQLNYQLPMPAVLPLLTRPTKLLPRRVRLPARLAGR